eukprot:4263767-Amphidinium_carterae.3
MGLPRSHDRTTELEFSLFGTNQALRRSSAISLRILTSNSRKLVSEFKLDLQCSTFLPTPFFPLRPQSCDFRVACICPRAAC